MMIVGVSVLGVALLWFFIMLDADPPGGGGAFNDMDNIPPPRIDTRMIRAHSGARSVDNPPTIMLVIPLLKWPIRKPRDKQLVSEVLRVFGPKNEVKFLVSEKDYERDRQGGLENIEGHVVPIDTRYADGNEWELTWRGLKRIAEVDLLKAEWFAVADINSMVVTTNLAAYVSYLDPSKPYYLGHVRGLDEWNAYGVLYNSPSAYVLSQGALRLLAIRMSASNFKGVFGGGAYSCVDAAGPQAGKRLGTCLREVGVEPLETRDSQGRQRFLLYRPSNRNEYKKCAPYPLSFANLADVQQYQTLEYYTLKQPYKDAFKGVEPPNGQPFRHTNADANGNNPSLGASREVGSWLRSDEAPACLSGSGSCDCAIRLPSGFEGGTCREGETVRHGATCEVRCKGKDSTATATCHNGWLVLPPLRCTQDDQAVCTVRAPDDKSIFNPKQGSLIASKGSVKVTCKEGYRLPGGKEQGSYMCFRGEISFGQLCSKCGTWTIKVKGKRYQNPGWEKITFNGVASDVFEVTGVATGSEQDPVKNCGQFGQPEQLILQEKATSTLVTALSCSNQEIDVIDSHFVESDRCI